jgi:hypothetical protein
VDPLWRPAFGTWSYNDGRLTITEEGLKYNVDILGITRDTFRIHSPGQLVVIRFAPAEPSPLPQPAEHGAGSSRHAVAIPGHTRHPAHFAGVAVNWKW